MARIKLIVPVLNNYQQAIEMLESVHCSEQWTLDIIPQWKLRWPLSRAWNKGIDTARSEGYEYALIVNDDILFHPQTIDNILRTFRENTYDVMLVSAINQRGQIANPYDIFGMEIPENPTIAESPDFSCFMVKPKTFLKEIGFFDENFIPAYFEDNDMHRRINLCGFKAITTTAAPYYHYGGGTQNNPSNPEGPVVSGDAFNRNAEYYARKWGGTPGAEIYDRPFNDPNKGINDW